MENIAFDIRTKMCNVKRIRHSLQQLKEAYVTNIRGVQNLLYSSIKWSYEYLKNGDSKSLLLLCSLFPKDYNIPLEYLVRYSKGLHLFKNLTIGRTRDRIYSITDELKSCYLLLQGDDEDCVKLHDVVRDVCLSIASSDELVRHDGLKEWPQEEDSYADCTAMCPTFDKIDKLPSRLQCPKLELLRMKFKKDKLGIPEDFFKGMNELKVLGVYYLKGELPSSFQSLVNLRTLCLDNCILYGGVLVLGSLRKLEVLSFYSSRLHHIPSEIVKLGNLKSSDLRFEKGPSLPCGVLVSLRKLEEIYLGSCYQEWKLEGVIADINTLQNLQTIQFCVYDEICLEQELQNLHPEKLMRFKITRSVGTHRGVRITSCEANEIRNYPDEVAGTHQGVPIQ